MEYGHQYHQTVHTQTLIYEVILKVKSIAEIHILNRRLDSPPIEDLKKVIGDDIKEINNPTIFSCFPKHCEAH